MRRNVRLFTLILALVMVIGTMSPIIVDAAKERGSLTIHKLFFPDEIPGGLEDGDWKEGTPPSGTEPLEGAEFSIWKLEEGEESPSGSADHVEITDSKGEAVFDNLPLGRYYVKGTKLPKGVTQESEDFIVDIPSTSTDRRDHIYDVHVYPKNAMTIGAARLLKVGDHEDEPLEGAKFDLYKAGINGDKELIAEGLVTGSDGWTEIVGDLEVGSYYFIETKAPDGYGLDQNKQEFTIEAGDHAYVEGELQEDKVIELTMKNSEKPEEPEQEVDKDSADIGETVRWTIKVDLPSNIETFEMYKITDKIDEALNYAGNLSVSVDFDTYTVTEPGNQGGGTLILDFVPEKLEGGKELVISFDTIINEKAVVGEEIPNQARLDYDNGFEEDYEESDIPKVVTGGAKFKKVDGKTDKALEGAEFIVFKETDDGKLYLVQDQNGINSWSDKREDATKFESDSDGKIVIDGLAYGTYFLEETKAPQVEGKNYRLLQEPEKFVVNADSHKSEIEIENHEGSSLPKTGGAGTILFTVVGLGLMGVAAKFYKREENKLRFK